MWTCQRKREWQFGVKEDMNDYVMSNKVWMTMWCQRKCEWLCSVKESVIDYCMWRQRRHEVPCGVKEDNNDNCVYTIINVFSSEPRPIGDISLWGRRERGVLNLIVKTLLLSLIRILDDYSNLLRYLWAEVNIVYFNEWLIKSYIIPDALALKIFLHK